MITRSGIYVIINKVNGKFYIGSAVNLKNRWSAHKQRLFKGIHHSLHLQCAWNKYGGENFYFGVLEPVENKSCLISREQYWMDELHPEYNICPTAGNSLGFRFTEEQKHKRSEAQKGKHHSDETRHKMSEAKKGKHLSKETKQKMSEAQRGENNPMYKQAKRWEYNGESKPLSTWAREYGLEPEQVMVRVCTHGWTIEKALLTPVNFHRR